METQHARVPGTRRPEPVKYAARGAAKCDL
jgi:hypothetical protein